MAKYWLVSNPQAKATSVTLGDSSERSRRLAARTRQWVKVYGIGMAVTALGQGVVDTEGTVRGA